MKKHFLSIFLIILMLAILLACSTDDPAPPNVAQVETRLVYKANQIPKIKGLLLANIGIQKSSSVFSANTGDGISELSIDWEEILQLVDSTGNGTYTFGIEDNDEDIGVFYNLILKIDASGSLQRPFLLKYSMTDEFLAEYLQTGSFENFSGSVQKILINGPGNSKGGYGYSANPNTLDDLSTSPCGDEMDINGGSNFDTGDGPSGGDWICQTFIVTDTEWWKVCDGDGCEIHAVEGSPELVTECEFVVESESVDAYEDCTPKDDVTPIKLPQDLDLLSKIMKSHNLTLEQLAVLRAELKKIVDNNCVYKSMYDNMVDKGVKLHFDFNPNLSAGGYSPNSKSIMFHSVGMISFTTLREELQHAYQDSFYPNGGISNYLEKGLSNIEFEVKLLNDMVTFATNGLACCQAFPGNLMSPQEQLSYLDWLLDITEDGTTFPDLGKIKGEYFHWLRTFVD